MKEQLKTIREALNTCTGLDKALTAIAQIEAMVVEQEPRTREQHLALREAHHHADSDAYFKARAELNTYGGRTAFEAGYQRGFDAAGALYATPVAQQPQAEPDMRKVCEALGFDPTNHHNAAKCPYCRGQQPQTEPLTDEQRLGWYAWRVKDLEQKLTQALKQPQAEVAHPAVKPDTLVNRGALQMALNVLRRAGKDEVADELEKTIQQPQAEAVLPGYVADNSFRWDGEKQQHIPRLIVEFEPVPANSPCNAKGWQDRDRAAKMFAAAIAQQKQ